MTKSTINFLLLLFEREKIVETICENYFLKKTLELNKSVKGRFSSKKLESNV